MNQSTEKINYPKNLRNDGIDFLRGLSIISVILLHLFIRMPVDITAIGKLLPQQITTILFRSGYYGVVIFFVVSGFLITTSSIKRWGHLAETKMAQFYRIRFARIAPCLIALIIILSMLHVLGIKEFVISTTTLQHAIFAALTFHINLLEAKTGYLPGAWDVLWSLSIEEMFYLFFPLTCILTRKKSIFIFIILIFIILGPFARTLSDNEIWSDHSYLSCMDGIAIGCLAALAVSKFKMNHQFLRFLFFTGLSLFLFVFIFRKQAYQLGLSKIGLNVTVLEIGVGLIIMTLHKWYVEMKHQGSWFSAPFRWFGRNSYEIYLTHMFIVVIMTQLFYSLRIPINLMALWYLIALVLSAILGQLVAIYYSEPMNRFLRKKQFIIPTAEYTKEH